MFSWSAIYSDLIGTVFNFPVHCTFTYMYISRYM